MQKKKRKGYSLVEAVCSLACIAFVAMTIISATSFLRGTAAQIEGYALIETYAVSLAETISADMRQGIDITDVDYSMDTRLNDPQRTGIRATIHIDWQEDVFGSPLYEVRATCAAVKYGIDREIRFFLREEGS